MMSDYKNIETERLILKPTSLEDAEFVFQLLNTPKWIANIGDRGVDSLEKAKDYIINRMHPQLKRLGYSNYTVTRKTDAAKLGSCGLYDREGLDGIDIGFAFFPAYEKKGYAFEAANKLKEVAIHEFGITEINAITIKENIASQKLLEKLGLKFKKLIQLSNDDVELMFYQWRLG